MNKPMIYGGEFGETLEALKARIPFTADMQGLGFDGDARKVGAVLMLAGCAGDLIAHIEQLTAELAKAQHLGEMMQFMTNIAYNPEFETKLDGIDPSEIPDPEACETPEAFYEAVSRIIQVAKDKGIWPIAEVPA